MRRAFGVGALAAGLCLAFALLAAFAAVVGSRERRKPPVPQGLPDPARRLATSRASSAAGSEGRDGVIDEPAPAVTGSDTQLKGAVGAAAHGAVITTPKLYLGAEEYAVRYRFSVTDAGALRHEVSTDDETWHLAREVGPGAVFGSNDLPDSVNCETYAGSYASLSPRAKMMCRIRDIDTKKDAPFRTLVNLNTGLVLATTSTYNDRRVFHLMITYAGLGILAAPRGADWTVSLFSSGWAPLFDDATHGRCGQYSLDFLVARGASSSRTAATPCGRACAAVLPYAHVPSGASPIWEMASPNGRYRLQFFDNGHVRFADRDAPPPAPFIYTTEPPRGEQSALVAATTGSYPRCTPKGVSPYVSPLNATLEASRDRWVIRGVSYKLELGTSYTTLTNHSLIVHLTDKGGLTFGKNYYYLSANHFMVQSNVGACGTSVAPDSQVGWEFDEDNKKKHYRLGNYTLCWGEIGNLDFGAGAAIAKTAPQPGDGTVYVLWLGPMGLRLFATSSGEVTAAMCKRFDACIWVTPIYRRWWFTDGDVSKGDYVANYSYSVCDSRGIEAPRKSMDWCGSVRKPVKTPSDTILAAISSPNKRYVFAMRSSGACDLLDLASPNSPLWTTDAYTSTENEGLCASVPNPYPPCSGTAGAGLV